jgi:amino acid transporter
MCYVAMVIVWTLTISLAVSFMTSQTFSKEQDSMCVPKMTSEGQPVFNYVTIAVITLYVISMALYGHIYYDVNKTSQRTVQLQRENRLARRISLIMFSNIIFIIIPFVSDMTLEYSSFISEKDKFIFWKTGLVTCLGINACLNPILFSFRNETFRNEFRRRCFLCSTSVAAVPAN